jgi:hypothetical protein
MNIRDANWKEILSCDALDLSVVYVTALGIARVFGAGHPQRPDRLNFAAVHGIRHLRGHGLVWVSHLEVLMGGAFGHGFLGASKGTVEARATKPSLARNDAGPSVNC